MIEQVKRAHSVQYRFQMPLEEDVFEKIYSTEMIGSKAFPKKLIPLE